LDAGLVQSLQCVFRAPAIAIDDRAQDPATTFVEFLEAGDLSEAAHERFNQRVNDQLQRSTLNFRSQRDVLMNIPQKV